MQLVIEELRFAYNWLAAGDKRKAYAFALSAISGVCLMMQPKEGHGG